MASDSCNAPLVTGWWHPACNLLGVSGAIEMLATYLLTYVLLTPTYLTTLRWTVMFVRSHSECGAYLHATSVG